MNTFTVSIKRHDHAGATCTITTPGRKTAVYIATKSTAERATLAALTGADIAWVPGTTIAKRKGKPVQLVFRTQGDPTPTI